jgi:hypothetical protein
MGTKVPGAVAGCADGECAGAGAGVSMGLTSNSGAEPLKKSW